MEQSIAWMSQSDLIDRITDRDILAFSELYNRFSSTVFHRSMKILRDKGEAEEVVQEVFLQIWNTAETYNSNSGQISTWIINITRSRAIVKLRNTRFKKQIITIRDEFIQLKYDLRMKVQEKAENRVIIKNVLEKLPKEQKKAIKIVYYDGLTHLEAAEKLKIPVGTIKTRIRLAVSKLRIDLSPFFNDSYNLK